MKLQRGPALMMLATLVFTVMVSLVKIARQELDVFDVILFRGLVAVPVALALARGKLHIERKGLLLLRSATGFGSMLCFFGAAKGLAIADLQIISRLQPLAVGFLAPLALGAAEKPKRGIWIVLVLGLLGCGIIIGPELAVGDWWGGLALGAVLFSAVSHTSVRALKGENSASVVFWFQLFVTVICGVIWLVTDSSLPPAHLIWILASVGALASLGQWLMTQAYAADSAANVAAASYVSPLFGAAMDWIAFSELPTWQALVGGTLIIGAGLWLVFRRADPSSESGRE
jgi:drug/metabolite transporter (DMT)-like permease